MTDHPNNRASIQDLQRFLRQLSLAEGLFAPPPIDGIFDTATDKALRSYQRHKGFLETGRADQATWEALYTDYRASLAKNSPPRAILLFPLDPVGFAYERADQRGFPIAAIQYMLRELQRDYDALADVEITGVYDVKTQNAVKAFQGKNRIEPHGKTDLLTWNTIADRYNTLASRYQRE